MNNVHQLVRIYDNPGHARYGECRRLWMMLEQLFADQPGGLAGFERRLWAFRERDRAVPIRWDEHLLYLLTRGLTEPDAQRTVLQQMLTAREWLA